jgi:hypothetical protein
MITFLFINGALDISTCALHDIIKQTGNGDTKFARISVCFFFETTEQISIKL